jgi:hypothetical protein
MGDVASGMQEAAYIMSRQGHTPSWNKLLRAPMFAMLSLLQLIAALSRVSSWPCSSCARKLIETCTCHGDGAACGTYGSARCCPMAAVSAETGHAHKLSNTC